MNLDGSERRGAIGTVAACRLSQSLQAQKADIEKACRIILEMAQARRLTDAAIMTQGFKDYQETVATLQRMNDSTREAYGIKKET